MASKGSKKSKKGKKNKKHFLLLLPSLLFLLLLVHFKADQLGKPEKAQVVTGRSVVIAAEIIYLVTPAGQVRKAGATNKILLKLI